MFKKIYVLALFVLGHLTGNGQRVVRNLGFEELDVNQQLVSWKLFNNKERYLIILDTSFTHTGKCAVSIASMPDATGDRGAAGFTSVLKFPDLNTRQKVRITAYVNTENLADGTASIAVQLDGAKGPIDMGSTDEQSAKGSSGWTKHSIEVPLTFDVQSITFGCKMTGTGKARFDDFEIFIDDVPVGYTLLIPGNKL